MNAFKKIKYKNSSKPIEKNTLISDITNKYPRSTDLLIEYGLYCVNCPLKQFETIEEGAKVHGMNDQEIEKMIKEINMELLESMR